MATNKTNDLVSLAMVNPDASINDLIASGITAANTNIRPEQDYINNPVVQTAQQFKDTQGNFSPAKFHQFYQNTINQYNALAQNTPKASKWDIFAKPETKDYKPDYDIKQIYNPDRVTHSMVEVGKEGPRTMSKQEIAQTQKVYDPKTRTYTDAPNNNFFGVLFGDTMALAQWDYDADAKGNPTSDPNKIVYHKGENKLNDQGTYYYEKLNGRSTHNRQVLHVSDILTDDDSFANKFDFIDSDGLYKSPMGSLMKNAALIGSMYIPYVGPVVAGISVAQQGLKLASVLGKMLTSSDNQSMNRLEGFAEKTDFFHTQSEYANEHPWALENMINMFGDTMGQLKQQRFLFEYAPAAFKGTTGISDENRAKKIAEYTKQFNAKNDEILTAAQEKLTNMKLSKLNDISSDVRNLQNQELLFDNQRKAEQLVQDYMKQYYKIGEIISKTYMTGITVQDMYQEAKDAGAGDKTAMLLTLGYAAAEAKLLNTGIGERILPELRAQKNAAKNIVKSMAGDSIKALNNEVENATTINSKRNIVKKIINIGKDIFTGSDNVIKESQDGVFKKTVMGNLANALGEGIEEVSEEVLADVVRTAHDLGNWVAGGNQKDMLNMQGWGTRYAMNFLGGFIGGGTHSVFQNYNTFKTYSNLSSQDAVKHVISMVRNGEVNQLYDALDKVDFGNKYLSTKLVQDDQGTYGYGVGSEQDNQNDIIKSAVKQQIKLIENTLNESGANISNESLLSQATLKELRYSALMKTKTAGKYIETFNNETQKLINLKQQILDYKQSFSDKDKRESNTNNDEYEAGLQPLLEQYKEQQQKVKDLADGKNSASFMTTALLETNPNLLKEFNDGVTFETFILAQTGGKKTIDTLSDSEKSDLMTQYEQYLKTDAADDVHIAATQYINLVNKIFGGSEGIISKYNLDDTNSQTIANVVKELYNYTTLLKLTGSNIADGNQFIPGATNIINPNLWITLQKLRGLVDDQMLDDFDTEVKATTDKLNSEYEAIKNKPISDTYTQDQKDLDLKEKEQDMGLISTLQITLFYNKLLPKIVEKEQARGWINTETKQYLLNLIDNTRIELGKINRLFDDWNNGELLPKSIQEYLGLSDFQLLPDYTTELSSINNLKSVINSLKTSPVEALLNKFILDVTGNNITIEELLGGSGGLNSILNAFGTNLNGFTINNEFKLYQLKQAIKATQMLHAIILGMRSDNLGHTVDISFGTNMYTQNLDLFGINETLNNLNKKTEGWKELPVIKGTSANELLFDLEIINRKLHFLLDLHEQNKNSKLIMQPKIQIQSTLNLYRKVYKLVINALPDDWDKSPITELSTLETFKGLKLDLSEDEQDNISLPLEQVMQDRIKMEDALYELFKTNVFEGSHKLDELLDNKLWDFFNTEESTLSSDKTNNINNIDFYYYLASHATVKSSNFYHAYKKYISNDIAPIFSQEQAIYLGTANVVNGQIITKFGQVLKSKMLDTLHNADFDTRVKLLSKYFNINSDTAQPLATDAFEKYWNEVIGPKFDNIIFIEGKAGTGKTAAVINTIASILKGVDPDTNAWIVNNTKENANKLSKVLKFNNSKSFDGNELLQFISNYELPERKNDSLQYEKGKHYDFDSEGNLIPKATFKNIDKKELPKVIIIDEVSRFTDTELKIINEFAKIHGIPVITAGDLHQISAVGKCEINIQDSINELKQYGINTENIPTVLDLQLKLSRNQLVHPFRLKDSLRTANTQSTLNNNTVEAAINNPDSELLFKYYENFDKQYELSGTKVFNYNNNKIDLNELEKSIKGLISTVKRQSNGTILEEDKIGYIYQSENTEIYKLITSPKYKEYFQLHQGGNSQGLESDYYVIELDPNPKQSSSNFISSLYTGISRSKKGNLLITQDSIIDANTGSKTYNNIKNGPMDESTETEPMPAGDIKHQSELVKKALEPIDGGDLTIIPRESKTLQDKNTTTNDDTEKDSNDTTELGLENFTEVETVDKDQLEQFITSTVNKQLDDLIKSDPTITNQGEKQKELYQNIINQIKTQREANGLSNIDDILNNILNTYNSDTLPPLPANSTEEPGTDEQTNDQETDQSSPETSGEGLNGTETTVLGVLDNANQDTEERPVTKNTRKHWLYTFNSFELGGFSIQDGKLQPTKGFNQDRIDGVCGILKVLQAYGKDPQEYLNNPNKLLNFIGRTQSIIRYATSKQDLNSKLLALFMQEFQIPIQNLKCDFILKSTISSKTAERNPQFNRFVKNTEEEQSLYNPTQGETNSFDKDIRACISMDDKGYVFELPIMTLNSPITVGNLTDSHDHPLYPTVYSILHNQNIKSFFDKCVEIVATKAAIKDGSTDLHNLFQLFLVSQAIVYKIDDNWLPGKDLINSGIHFAGKTGGFQLNGKFIPNGIISLRELSAQQNLKITPVLIARNSTITINNEQGTTTAKVSPKQFGDTAGYPFVLVTDNLELSDEQMYQQYLKQLSDSSEPKIVKQIFVIPPVVTFDSYINGLKAFNDTDIKNVRPSGNNYTIYNVWQALLKGDEKYIKDRIIHYFGNEVYDKFINTISAIEATKQDYKKGAKILGTTENWGRGSYGKNTTVERNLIYMLRYICFPDAYDPKLAGTKFVESKDFNKIKTIFNNSKYKVRENVKMDSDKMLGDFHYAKVINYAINGKPILVQNKITTSTYKDVDSITKIIDKFVQGVSIKYGDQVGNTIEDLAEQTKDNPNNHVIPWYLLSGNLVFRDYYTGKKHFSLGTSEGDTQESFNPSDKYTKLQNDFGDLIPKIDYSTITSQEQADQLEQKAINTLCDNINSNPDMQQFAYIDSNGNFQITEEQPMLKGVIQDLHNGNVIINGVTYEINYDNGQITLDDLTEPEKPQNILEYPNIPLTDQDVLYITKGKGNPTGIIKLSNRLLRKIKRANSQELVDIETAISQTKDINELRPLALKKLELQINLAKSLITKPSLRANFSLDIESTDKSLQDQLREYFKQDLNNLDSDIEEKNRCNSIVINLL